VANFVPDLYGGGWLTEESSRYVYSTYVVQGHILRHFLVITRLLVDELALPPAILKQWTDFELSQFVVPVTCPKFVLPIYTLFLFASPSHAPSNLFFPRCTKPNLFELLDYNRSKILICTHGCECAWCRDCSRKVDIQMPHDCGDAALDELAGERRWMRCPRPSTFRPGARIYFLV